MAPAEKDPSKFGLDPSEVTSRRAWLNETKGKVDRINGFLQRAAQEAADKAAARAGKMKGLGADDKLNNACVGISRPNFYGNLRINWKLVRKVIAMISLLISSVLVFFIPPCSVVQENDKYINGLQNRQQQIIKQQDKVR